MVGEAEVGGVLSANYDTVLSKELAHDLYSFVDYASLFDLETFQCWWNTAASPSSRNGIFSTGRIYHSDTCDRHVRNSINISYVGLVSSDIIQISDWLCAIRLCDLLRYRSGLLV